MDEKITSIESLVARKDGIVAELHGFYGNEGDTFIAKIRRPSVMGLAASGKIPNDLLGAASKLFATGKVDESDKSMLKHTYEVMAVIAKAVLVEPSYAELEKAGISLTDEQLVEIFQFTQVGVNALTNFRKK